MSLSSPPDGMSQEVIDFRTRSPMPDEDVDLLWAERAGYLEAALSGALANIYARLRKRYVTPMDPKPEIVVEWQARMVTPKAYRARGYNPQDPILQVLDDDRKLALEEIKEAADAEAGLYDLPLLSASDTTAIAKGGPYVYSEASPYDWTDVQREVVRNGR